MNTAQLYETLLRIKLRHALLLERQMIALLASVKRGDTQAATRYEWCMQAAKALATKDLLGLGKQLQPAEEASFDGFEDA